VHKRETRENILSRYLVVDPADEAGGVGALL
jgi:hypothetical protein